MSSHFYSMTLGKGRSFFFWGVSCCSAEGTAWTLRDSALGGTEQHAALSLNLKGFWCSSGQTTRWLTYTVTGASFISKFSPWVPHLREWRPTCPTHVAINLNLSTPAHRHLCCSSQGAAGVLSGASLVPHIPVRSEHSSSDLCWVLCSDRTFQWWSRRLPCPGSVPPFPAVVFRRLAAVFCASPAFLGISLAAHAQSPWACTPQLSASSVLPGP